jgi:anti-sigma regulatory factor (Ser/Thr protein kinase)
MLMRATTSGVGTLTLGLRPTPQAAASAREYVRTFCHTPELEPLADVASLVVSELVSNALQHAETPMTLSLRVNAGVLRMEVADHSSTDVELPAEDLLREGGRGLAIVASLVGTQGKSVWAELAV